MVKEIATFALGCFWEPQEYFSNLDGVISTKVGYSGGEFENPIYSNLADHSETIEIEFDNKKISYEELLKHFWKLHNPTKSQRRQYQSIIFYNNETQKESAQKSKKLQQLMYEDIDILTWIMPRMRFYLAEEYHQNYLTKKKK